MMSSSWKPGELNATQHACLKCSFPSEERSAGFVSVIVRPARSVSDKRAMDICAFRAELNTYAAFNRKREKLMSKPSGWYTRDSTQSM
jgi:hypothetical protein